MTSSCASIEPIMMAVLAGEASADEREQLEAHLAECPACQAVHVRLTRTWSAMDALPEAVPSPLLRKRFDTMLAAYRSGRTERPSPLPRLEGWLQRWWPRRPLLQAALAIGLLVAGWTLGAWWNASPPPGTAELETQVAELNRLVTLALLDDRASTARLKGVQFSRQIAHPDSAVIDALLGTLNRDPNVNVRLAALDALAAYMAHPAVRNELAASLARQESPLIQVSLINLLVRRQVEQSAPELRKLLERPDLDPAVRDKARDGLNALI